MAFYFFLTLALGPLLALAACHGADVDAGNIFEAFELIGTRYIRLQQSDEHNNAQASITDYFTGFLSC